MEEVPAFRLDPVNQCLWRRTQLGEYERVLLTPTEFGVLDHLVEHAGRLVTHRELLDAVWPHTAIEPQAVKSKVFHLRRVLDDDPKQPRFIETLPRRGYRFVGTLERAVVDDHREQMPVSHLVGRDGALAELRQYMRLASTGRLQIVFVTGEAGIGKTALVEEFQRRLAVSDPTIGVARGQCVEGFASKEAFYPVLQAVGELCHGASRARIVDALAAHAPTWLAQFPALLTPQLRERLQQEILGATRDRMLREIGELLETTTAPTPVLLVLEDLHWADPSTLDLIAALARRRIQARLMIIATYRPSDLARSAQPLHALKRDLVARDLGREIALQPLNVGEIGQYLAAGQSKPEVAQDLAVLVHDHTEGNPLFMIAVLEHLEAHGLLDRSSGAWRLQRPVTEISVEVPDTLRQMISAQIDRMGETEQCVLEVSAITGMSFAPAICAPAAEMDPAAFEESCYALARRGHLLRVADALELPHGEVVQRYAFVHALYREVLYERQPPARRAMLHRRVAERLEQIFAATLDDVAAELAHQFELGADWSRAVTYLRHAADVAAGRYSVEGAKANLQHALVLSAKLALPGRVTAETEILDTLADICLGTFDARAVDFLTLLRARAAEHGLIDVGTKALVDLAHPLSWADAEAGLGVIEQALKSSESQIDPLTRAHTRARCMVRRIWTRGWSDLDAAECRSAIAEIQRLGTPRDAAWHVVDCDFVDVFSSQYRKAVRDATESLSTLSNGQRASTYLSYVHSLKEFSVSWSLILLGEWGAALRELDAGISLAEKNGEPYRAESLLMIRAWGQLYAQDFEGALAVCDGLFPRFQQPVRAPWRRFCLAIAGAAEAALGHHDTALAHLTQAGDEMDRRTVLGDWYWRLVQQWALTNLWLSKRDLPTAREHAERFVASAGATAERTWHALAWEASARIALVAGDVTGAQHRVERALHAIGGVEVPVAAWQAHATAAAVSRARGDVLGERQHREKSREVVLSLAASFGPNQERMRQSFLSASAVSQIISRGTIGD